MNNAYAYIDPGTSSMLLQVIVGALVGVGITIKVYWEKIKFRIISRTKKDLDEVTRKIKPNQFCSW